MMTETDLLQTYSQILFRKGRKALKVIIGLAALIVLNKSRYFILPFLQFWNCEKKLKVYFSFIYVCMKSLCLLFIFINLFYRSRLWV